MNDKELEIHVKMLKENMAKGLSKDEQTKQMNDSLGRKGLFFNLEEHLRTQTNEQITDKMKGRHTHLESYFALREEKTERAIFKTDWRTWFEKNATLQELEDLAKNPSMCPFDHKTLMLIVIEGLKSYADNLDEKNPKCSALHEIYLKLKSALSIQIPFPEGDGFEDYLNQKPQREAQETARFSGEICIFCGSRNVRSCGDMWKCYSCLRKFRKHQQ